MDEHEYQREIERRDEIIAGEMNLAKETEADRDALRSALRLIRADLNRTIDAALSSAPETKAAPTYPAKSIPYQLSDETYPEMVARQALEAATVEPARRKKLPTIKELEAILAKEDAGEPKVLQVEIGLCELCLGGKGGECHVPGCALCRNRAPDMPITPELYRVIAEPRPNEAESGLGRWRHLDRATLERVMDECADDRVKIHRIGKAESDDLRSRLAQREQEIAVLRADRDGLRMDLESAQSRIKAEAPADEAELGDCDVCEKPFGPSDACIGVCVTCAGSAQELVSLRADADVWHKSADTLTKRLAEVEASYADSAKTYDEGYEAAKLTYSETLKKVRTVLEAERDTLAARLEQVEGERDELREALRELVDVVVEESNAAHSISGRMGARLHDARAALSSGKPGGDT